MKRGSLSENLNQSFDSEMFTRDNNSKRVSQVDAKTGDIVYILNSNKAVFIEFWKKIDQHTLTFNTYVRKQGINGNEIIEQRKLGAGFTILIDTALIL